jgi:hypothetical protein
MLSHQDYHVFMDKSFPDPNNTGATLRPDLIAIEDAKALVRDISVVYEITSASFKNTYLKNRSTSQFRLS